MTASPARAVVVAAQPATKAHRRRRPAPWLWVITGLAPLAALLVIWSIVQQKPSPYFPSPVLWWKALVAMSNSGILWSSLLDSTVTFVEALVIASILGGVLGLLVGRLRFADRLTNPLFVFLRVLPPAAVIPLVVLFAGYTSNMKIGVVVFTAIWPVLLTVRSGAINLPPGRSELARSLRMNGWQRLRKVLIPSLMPSFLLGVRLASSIVLISVLLVEIVTQIPGLGALISTMQQNFQSAAVYALVCVTGLLGLVMNVLVSLLERLALRYDPRTGND